MASNGTIVVSGALANKHSSGGAIWTRLSWALGLRELGYRVCFVEQMDPATCVDVKGAPTEPARSANVAVFKQVVGAFGLGDLATLIIGDGPETVGLPWPRLLGVAEGADLLVNITGHLTLAPLKRRFRRTAYVDLDPGYTQFWHVTGGFTANLADHDVYFTVGAIRTS